MKQIFKKLGLTTGFVLLGLSLSISAQAMTNKAPAGNNVRLVTTMAAFSISQMENPPNTATVEVKEKEKEIPKENWEPLSVPAGTTSFKAQESYTIFKNASTKQYQLQHDGKAWTDVDGFRRYGTEGYYMVAMGSYYNKQCGTILKITLDSGRTFKVITGDQKADIHTDTKNQYCKLNNSVLEFIVDMRKINTTCKRRGDMSFAPNSSMEGNIVKIERLV